MPLLKKPGLAKPKLGAARIAPKTGGAFKRPAKAEDEFAGEPKHSTRKSGAFGQARAEKQKQELASLKPYNCKVPVGGSLEVYILDAKDPWTRYEHKVGGGPTSSGVDYPCIKDSPEQCPLCTREGKEGRFMMYLTCVVPIEKYEKADGEKVTRRFSKKLFPITTKMAGKYERLFEKHGNLRGAVLRLSRDNKMDPATGNDVEFVRRLTEKQIAEYAAGKQISDREQRDRVVKAKIGEAFEYDKVMPTPKAKELAAMIGMKSGGGVGGSDFAGDSDADDFGAEDNWGSDD